MNRIDLGGDVPILLRFLKVFHPNRERFLTCLKRLSIDNLTIFIIILNQSKINNICPPFQMMEATVLSHEPRPKPMQWLQYPMTLVSLWIFHTIIKPFFIGLCLYQYELTATSNYRTGVHVLRVARSYIS